MLRYFSLLTVAATATLALGCSDRANKVEAANEKGRPILTSPDDDPDLSVAAQAKDLPRPAEFDGKRAMGYLKAVCDIGPRMSATKGMRTQQALIRKHFEDLGIPIKSQEFQGRQKSKLEPVEMTNLIASFAPERTRRVIICTHYDTRPIADQEPDPRKWRETFVSANDGGSSVAWLMEFAHHLKKLKLEVGVDLVFFDGEEYIFDREADQYFIGSKHFAKTWVDNNRRPKYLAAVLLDSYSWQRHPGLCDEIWTLARPLECPAFRRELGDHVLDDHTALQEVGIPAIDIIDFRYPHWHKLTDTPENCSPDGMLQVSKVLSVWVQRLK